MLQHWSTVDLCLRAGHLEVVFAASQGIETTLHKDIGCQLRRISLLLNQSWL